MLNKRGFVKRAVVEVDSIEAADQLMHKGLTIRGVHLQVSWTKLNRRRYVCWASGYLLHIELRHSIEVLLVNYA